LPQDHEVTVGGMRLHYLDWGGKDSPPMVFLHGGALTAHTWDLVCLALRGDYHCIALDQRGHGDSGWAEDADYSIGAQLADTKGFVDKIGLARITCPTLVVRGGESDVFHEEDGIRLAQRLPDGKFVTVPRAGHTVQGDNPKDLVTELRRFLAGDN